GLEFRRVLFRSLHPLVTLLIENCSTVSADDCELVDFGETDRALAHLPLNLLLQKPRPLQLEIAGCIPLDIRDCLMLTILLPVIISELHQILEPVDLAMRCSLKMVSDLILTDVAGHPEKSRDSIRLHDAILRVQPI